MNRLFKAVSLSIILALVLPIIALAVTYVGNKNSYVFHYQGCRAERKMRIHNKVYFSNRSEAIDFGMRPCGICRP